MDQGCKKEEKSETGVFKGKERKNPFFKYRSLTIVRRLAQYRRSWDENRYEKDGSRENECQ